MTCFSIPSDNSQELFLIPNVLKFHNVILWERPSLCLFFWILHIPFQPETCILKFWELSLYNFVNNFLFPFYLFLLLEFLLVVWWTFWVRNVSWPELACCCCNWLRRPRWEHLAHPSARHTVLAPSAPFSSNGPQGDKPTPSTIPCLEKDFPVEDPLGRHLFFFRLWLFLHMIVDILAIWGTEN